MPLASTQAENAALAGLDGTGTVNVIGFVGLQTGSPGVTGANESPSTTRAAATWNAPAGGSRTNSSALQWTTPGTTPCTYFGCYKTVNGADFSLGGALAAAVTATTITAAAGALSLAGS